MHRIYPQRSPDCPRCWTALGINYHMFWGWLKISRFWGMCLRLSTFVFSWPFQSPLNCHCSAFRMTHRGHSVLNCWSHICYTMPRKKLCEMHPPPSLWLHGRKLLMMFFQYIRWLILTGVVHGNLIGYGSCWWPCERVLLSLAPCFVGSWHDCDPISYMLCGVYVWCCSLYWKWILC